MRNGLAGCKTVYITAKLTNTDFRNLTVVYK